MAKKVYEEANIQAIADQIREFTKETKSYTTAEMTTGIIDAVEVQLSNIIEDNASSLSNSRSQKVSDYSFYKNQNLITAELLNATEIGDYAFYQCPELTTINAPLVQQIGAFAFRDCVSLNQFNCLNAQTIGDGAFDGCLQLSELNFGAVVIIPNLAFRNCELLTEVDLALANSIGEQAFWNSGISKLILRASTVCALTDENAFYFTPIESGTGYIYVPSNLVETYKTSSNWSTYANQILSIDSLN